MNTHPTAKIKVERYNLERVPETEQQTKWYEYAIIQGSFSVNTGNFLVPAFAVLQGGLSVLAAILATIVGAAFAFLCVSILSIPGAKYGVPAQYALRSILGTRGARWVSSPVRGITSLYWFSVQTIGGTFVLQAALLTYFNIDLSFSLLAILLGTVMVVLAMVGFDAIKKTLKYFFPLLLLGQLVILFLFIEGIMAHEQTMTIFVSGSESSIQTVLFYGSLAFVQYIAGIHSSSDLTRYSKNHKHGFYGLLTGNMVGFAIVAILGTISAGFYQDINPFIASSLLTESGVLLTIILLSALLSMISINLNNVYTGAFCLLNSIPRLGRIKATIIFGMVAITLCTFPALVNEAESYISWLGLVVIPLAAVIVVDFLWIKKGKLTNVENESSTEMVPFKYNKRGLLFVAFGAVFYYLIPEPYSPGFLTFLFVGLTYGFMAKSKKLRKVKWKIL